MQKHKIKTEFKELTLGPAYPLAGPNLFMRLRAALTECLGFQPSYPRLAQMLGFGGSKAHYWFTIFRHPHVIAFLCLLERLPSQKRNELMSVFCRELPALDHSRVCLDPMAASSLEDLLNRSAALVVVRGGTDFQRVFVTTTIGHSFLHGQPKRTVAGLDAYPPKKWVPIEGVFYARQPLPPAGRRDVLSAAWPAIRASGAQMFLFNGIWSVAAELQKEIVGLANSRLVVLADETEPDLRKIAALFQAPMHIVGIQSNGDAGQPMRIKVQVL